MKMTRRRFQRYIDEISSAPAPEAVKLIRQEQLRERAGRESVFDPPSPDISAHQRRTAGIPWLVENGLPYPTHVSDSGLESLDLGGTWTVWFEDGSCETVELPSTLNSYNSGRGEYLGMVCYERTLVLGDEFRGRIADGFAPRLRMEGFLNAAAVYADGVLIAARRGGYTPLFAPIDPVPEDRVSLRLHILVDNRPQFHSLPARLGRYNTPGWHTYLGIHRELAIDFMPETTIFKAAAIPRGGNRLEISVLASGRAESFRLELKYPTETGDQLISRDLDATFHPDEGGLPVSSARTEVKLPAVLPWSPESPGVIRMEIEAWGTSRQLHRVVVLTGYRIVNAGPDALIINGRRQFLRGICKHEDHPDHGASNPPELIEADLDLIQGLNANYVRLAHYPHHPAELDELRRRGFWLSQEIPFYQLGNGYAHWYADSRPLKEIPLRYFGMRQIAHRRVKYEAKRQLLEMVERDINHPGIIIWGVANESYSLSRSAARLYREFDRTLKSHDDSRLSTMAEFTSGKGILDRRRQGGRFLDILSYNIYLGWYYGAKETLASHLEEIRRKFPGKALLLSEFGAGAAPGRHDFDGEFVADRVPPGKTYGEEFQRDFIRHYIETAGRYPWIAGVSPWVLSDFYCPEFPNNPVPYFNIKGLVSRDREIKLAYEYLKEAYGELSNRE
jgi:hypothetical protein